MRLLIQNQAVPRRSVANATAFGGRADHGLAPPLAKQLPLFASNASRANGLGPDWLEQTPANTQRFTPAVEMANLLARQPARKPFHLFALSTE